MPPGALTSADHNCSITSLPSRSRVLAKFFAAEHRTRPLRTTKLFAKPWVFPASATVLDVGSNVGSNLIEFMTQGAQPSVAVHTYEPVAAIRERLEVNVRRFPQIHVHPFGLASENRTACFRLGGKHNLEGTTAVSQLRSAGSCARGQTEATLVAIGDVLDSYRRIQLLHVNCEGCEYDIIPGIPATALNRIDAIELQAHPLENRQLAAYCALEAHLRAARFARIYRFPFVWELWARPHANRTWIDSAH